MTVRVRHERAFGSRQGRGTKHLKKKKKKKNQISVSDSRFKPSAIKDVHRVFKTTKAVNFQNKNREEIIIHSFDRRSTRSSRHSKNTSNYLSLH